MKITYIIWPTMCVATFEYSRFCLCFEYTRVAQNAVNSHILCEYVFNFFRKRFRNVIIFYINLKPTYFTALIVSSNSAGLQTLVSSNSTGLDTIVSSNYTGLGQ